MIWGMELKLPKGTILRRTIANDTDVKNADGAAYINWEDGGVVVTPASRADSLATSADFKIGNRIRIYAGYTTQWEEIAYLANVHKKPTNIYNDELLYNKYRSSMDKVFDGYITQCSPSTPLIIKGENIASVFKKISCPKRSAHSATLKDLFDPSGTYRLLHADGREIIALHSENPLDSLGSINISPISLANEMTLADAFSEWSRRFGLFFRVMDEAGIPKLKIGYTYSSGASPGGSMLCICKNVDGVAPQIFFDYNVANDGLSYLDVDPYYMILKCVVPIIKAKGGRAKYTFHLKLKPDGGGGYEMFDQTLINRKTFKNKSAYPYFNRSGYTVIDRLYPKAVPEASVINGGMDGIFKEWAIKQFEDAIENGLKGSLTLFGDLGIHTGEVVELVDNRHTKRNGQYIVESVVTSMSTNGLRQTIQMPYKL